LHILHIDTGVKWRGGQQQAWWLMEDLRKLGAHQTLLIIPQSEFAKRAPSLVADASAGPAINIRNLSPSTGKVLNYENARLVREASAGCDLIHAHDAHAHTLAWAAQKMSRKRLPPVVVARRVTFPIRWLGRLKNRRQAWFIAVSEFVRTQLIESGIPAERVFVVRDGVRLPSSAATDQQRGRLRQQLGIDERGFVLGTLSSLAPEKLLNETLRLIAALPANFYFLLGVPEAQAASRQADELQRCARDLGISDRVHLMPVGAGAEELLWSLDTFLYFSKSEGLGSAILLAMAHSLPVVASRTGGIPEIVEHNETGILIDTSATGWESSAREAILALQASPDTRNRFGTRGRAFVAEQATSDNMVARTLAIYKQILAAQAEESRLA
jgi:L-malate glycosyltransferase